MLVIVVKVTPNSGRTIWVLDKNGCLKCFLKSAPEKGAANKELIRFLANKLGIAHRDIAIITGLTNRKKRIRIRSTITYEEFLKVVELEKHMSLFLKS